MTMTMGGLVKPISRRGAPAARRPNPSIRSNQRAAVCGSRRNDSPFISSYHEDKKVKYRQQMKEKMKKWLVWGSLVLVIITVVMSRSSTSDESALRGAEQNIASMGTKSETNIFPSNADNPPASASGGDIKPVTTDGGSDTPGDPSIVHGKTVDIEKGVAIQICSKDIVVNLADTSKYPTPYTPLLGDGKVPSDAIAKEVVLLKRDSGFGGLGCQLNSFFHAYDVAYDTGRPLYITQDAWVMDTLLPLFFGPSHEKNAKLWTTLEKVLRVKIVENEGVLQLMGIKVPNYQPPHSLFYTRSKKLDATQIRNHRETILRQLFQYPAMGSGIGENVCSTLQSLTADQNDKKYSVIHLAGEGQSAWLSKLNTVTGKDHTAATEMQPDYVKNILKQMDMLQHNIFPIGGDNDPINSEIIARLSKDPELAGHIRTDSKANHIGGKVYLAVLADVYLGNPVDQLSLWIARMRMALGKGGTFVLTEKRGDQWVSYVDATTHLELYDAQKLGLWMG